jgi:hypothetical protein
MRVRTRLTTATVALSLVLGFAPAAHAEQVVADITIRSVRLTEQLVLRVEATYICPNGFSVSPQSPPRAHAVQQTAVYPSSRSKTFDGITQCDGSQHDVLVRFVHPSHPRDAAGWEFDALTQIQMSFQAHRDDPFASVAPADGQMVTTAAEPSDRAEVAADLTIERMKMSSRGVIRVRAGYVCPQGFAVDPTLPPLAFLQQVVDGQPRAQKRFDGIVCDGIPGVVSVRFARPRQPDGARWEPGALTRVGLVFQANTEDPYLFVLASDAQSVLI